MMIALGVLAVGMFALSFTTSLVHASVGNYEKSHNNEMLAVGWFIAMCICFK